MCNDADKTAIRNLLATYAESIKTANPDMAVDIWQMTEQTTYIHPRGNEYGWNAIKTNFYGKTMGERFTQRELQIHDIHINIYGDTAVVVFFWDFPAVFRSDGTHITTHGRETQVLRKMDGSWKIVHIHYSNMPVTGNKQGF